MAIRQLDEPVDRDTAVVIMVPQRDIDWSDLPQASEKPESVRQP